MLLAVHGSSQNSKVNTVHVEALESINLVKSTPIMKVKASVYYHRDNLVVLIFILKY